MKTTHGAEINVGVHSLLVEDRMQQWGDNFKILATSEVDRQFGTEAADAPIDLDTDLIQVNYKGTDPSSPFYENVKHAVELRCHKLHVMFNRTTIVTLP